MLVWATRRALLTLRIWESLLFSYSPFIIIWTSMVLSAIAKIPIPKIN